MKIPYQKIKQGWLVFAGYFYLYIVVGNVLGEILVRLGDNEKGACFPHWTMFGLFTYDCKSILLGYIWEITIATPRFFVSFPALAVYFIWPMVYNGGFSLKYFLEGSWWLLVSSPAIILIFIPGFFYWKTRHYYTSWAMIAIHLIMIIYQ